MGKKKEIFNCRQVLWCLVFCGFAIHHILELNLNITIIAMVIPQPEPVAVAQCNVKNNILSKIDNETFQDNVSLPITTSSYKNVTYEDRFSWTEYEQGLVLGSYFWLHWLLQLPSGLLAKRYGTKLVFGLGNLVTALLGFLIPYMTHLYAFIFLRMMQGLVAGVIWPSMHDMTAKWIPQNERSTFISAYIGCSVGAAITYPLCALTTSLGWGASFHVTSLLGVIWYVFWYFFVYDSPQQHPRISDKEKNYILENIADSVDEKKILVPWKSIILSKQVWLAIIAHWSMAWCLLTLLTEAPTYLTVIHGWDIKTTGFLTGVPCMLEMVFSYLYSIMSDWLLRTKRMSLTNVRKMATFMSTGLEGLFILALGYSGCHPLLAVIFMMISIMLIGAVSASTFSIFVDLSPNYASIVLGFDCSIVTWSGFISPAIVGMLTNNNQTVEQWRLVFIISAAISVTSCIIYTIFGSVEEQPWNQYGKLDTREQKLRKIKVKRNTEIENDAEKSSCLEEKDRF